LIRRDLVNFSCFKARLEQC